MMKTDMKHISALAVSLVAAVSSCTGVRVETDDIRQTGTPILMSVSADGPATKAMFDRPSFSAEGNVLKIWDVYYNSVVEPFAYIDGTNVVSDGKSGIWPFRSDENVGAADEHYFWTKTGTHRFYGVLTKDNSGASAALRPADGWGFDAAHKVYSVPVTEMNLNSTQFDFLYSNVIERNLDDGAGTSAVPLKFKHLFSAFGFTLNNDSPSDFELKSVTLKVDNVASAKIDYSNVWNPDFVSNDIETSWLPETEYDDFSMNPATGIAGKPATLKSEDIYDLFHGTTLDAEGLRAYDGYRLIWPQDLTGKTLELSYKVTVKKAVTKFVYSWYGSGGWDVTFSYVGTGKGDYVQRNGWQTYYEYVGEGKGSYAVTNYYSSTSGRYSKDEQTVTETEENTLPVAIDKITPEGRWEAGKRYLYNLAFSNNELALKVTVMQWNDEHGGDVEFN